MARVLQDIVLLMVAFKSHKSFNAVGIKEREAAVDEATRFLGWCKHNGRWPGKLAPNDFTGYLGTIRASGERTLPPEEAYFDSARRLLPLISFLGDRYFDPDAASVRFVVEDALRGFVDRTEAEMNAAEHALDMGRPGWASRMLADLRSAGYDVTNNQGLTLGTVALNTAEAVRSASCPGRAPAGATPWQLIPRLADNDAMHADAGRLDRLLRQSPVLKGLRFPKDKCAACVHDAMAELAGAGPEEISNELGRIAEAFVEEHVSPDFFKEVGDRLLDAAPEVSEDIDSLRALATGIMFAQLESAPRGKFPPTLLREVVFRVSASDILFDSAASTVSDLLLQATPDSGFRGDCKKAQEEFEKLDPIVRERIVKSAGPAVRALLDKMREWLDSGKCPIGLPEVSVLPLLTDLWLARKAHGKGWQPPAPLVGSMTRAELEQLVDEDWRLFSAIVTSWLDSHPAADADTRRNLAVLRAMAMGAGLSGGTDFDLLMHTFTQGKLAKLPLDAEVDDGPKSEGPINATHLDSLATVLLNAGYRKLALRTWKLIGRLGPIPEHILGRIAAVEAETPGTPEV